MSKIISAVCLSIIGILSAVILVNNLVEAGSEQQRPQPKRIAIFPLVALDSSSAAAESALTGDLTKVFSDAECIEVISKAELQPELRSSADHNIWAKELLADLELEGSVKSNDKDFLVLVQVIDAISQEYGLHATFTVDGELLAQVAKETGEDVY
jgi:TolB-like protein